MPRPVQFISGTMLLLMKDALQRDRNEVHRNSSSAPKPDGPVERLARPQDSWSGLRAPSPPRPKRSL